MRDRVVELLLAACQECGALQLRDLYVEVALLADGKEFTSAEVCAHAALPENHRLQAAIAAVCGDDFGAGKVGKLFAQYAGVDIAGTVITRIGEDANAILWSCQSQPEQAPRAESDNIGALPTALGKRYAR